MEIYHLILYVSLICLGTGLSFYYIQIKNFGKLKHFTNTIQYAEISESDDKIKNYYLFSKLFTGIFHVIIVLYVIPDTFEFRWFETNDNVLFMFQIIFLISYSVSAVFFPQIVIFKIYKKYLDNTSFR